MADRRRNSAIELHLIRHPRTVAPHGICYGSTDLTLADNPEVCAKRLQVLLPPRFKLWTSPAQRCMRLASLLHEAPRIDGRLAEIHFGEWEMQSFEQLPRESIDAWAADPLGFRPPSGETAAEMANRVALALDEILGQPAEPQVIVTHGGPLRVIAGRLLDMQTAQWLGWQFEFGSVTTIETVGRSVQSVLFNR